MADGVDLPAAGVKAATDDCGADGHVGIVKLAVPTNGVATTFDLTALATDAVAQAIVDRLGEVQATPTANTLLARLKQIHEAVDTLEGLTDGVEAALAPLATDTVAQAIRDRIGAASAPDSGTTNQLLRDGTYGYDAGTAAGTIDVPATARLRRVSVLAGATAATIAIGGGDTITVVAGSTFDEQIPGEAVGADVVLGGDVDAYYVSWVV